MQRQHVGAGLTLSFLMPSEPQKSFYTGLCGSVSVEQMRGHLFGISTLVNSPDRLNMYMYKLNKTSDVILSVFSMPSNVHFLDYKMGR